MANSRKEDTHGYGFPMKLQKPLAALLAGLLICATATVTVSALEPHGTGIKMRKWLVNDPNYAFSSEYKTSVWYENFTTLKLGRNDRNNVLRIAVSQLGYHEGNSSADFDGMNHLGTDNYIEYARLLTPNWNNNSFDWCACFVNWCLNQARFDKASSEISCGNWITELKGMDMWQASAAYGGKYLPQPADFIFFDWDKNNQWSDHIGFVLYTTATHVHTIEGNANDQVMVRSYELDDPRVMGYGTPPYKTNGETTLDYSYETGMPQGLYVVSGNTANLTDRLGNNPFCPVPQGSTVRLHAVKGNYVLVSYNGKRGYLPKSCLYLMSREYTLTYDANGGQKAPDEQHVTRGQATAVSEVLPILEGDRFLGWSLVPYNLKVDYRAGEPITLTQNTVLYAVWETYSEELARRAWAQGLIPEYERPDTIQNSSAILLGSLADTELFTDCGDTNVALATDEEAGRVLAFSSTELSRDPYVVLPYGTLCRSLRLAPAQGEDIAYAVLRVKNVSMSNMILEISCNSGQCTAEARLDSKKGWQYAVFDLTDSGMTESLKTLRIDWQEDSAAAGETMLIADLFLASSEEMKDALVDGKYVYPVQVLSSSHEHPSLDPSLGETDSKDPDQSKEPETAANPEDETRPSAGSPDEEKTTGDDSSEPQPHSTGCSSILRTSAWVGTVLFACLPAIFRRKED